MRAFAVVSSDRYLLSLPEASAADIGKLWNPVLGNKLEDLLTERPLKLAIEQGSTVTVMQGRASFAAARAPARSVPRALDAGNKPTSIVRYGAFVRLPAMLVCDVLSTRHKNVVKQLARDGVVDPAELVFKVLPGRRFVMQDRLNALLSRSDESSALSPSPGTPVSGRGDGGASAAVANGRLTRTPPFVGPSTTLDAGVLVPSPLRSADSFGRVRTRGMDDQQVPLVDRGSGVGVGVGDVGVSVTSDTVEVVTGDMSRQPNAFVTATLDAEKEQRQNDLNKVKLIGSKEVRRMPTAQCEPTGHG